MVPTDGRSALGYGRIRGPGTAWTRSHDSSRTSPRSRRAYEAMQWRAIGESGAAIVERVRERGYPSPSEFREHFIQLVGLYEERYEILARDRMSVAVWMEAMGDAGLALLVQVPIRFRGGHGRLPDRSFRLENPAHYCYSAFGSRKTTARKVRQHRGRKEASGLKSIEIDRTKRLQAGAAHGAQQVASRHSHPCWRPILGSTCSWKRGTPRTGRFGPACPLPTWRVWMPRLGIR